LPWDLLFLSYPVNKTLPWRISYLDYTGFLPKIR
jgi:hypothetical protein